MKLYTGFCLIADDEPQVLSTKDPILTRQDDAIKVSFFPIEASLDNLAAEVTKTVNEIVEAYKKDLQTSET